SSSPPRRSRGRTISSSGLGAVVGSDLLRNDPSPRFWNSRNAEKAVDSFRFSVATRHGLRFALTTRMEVTRRVQTILVVDDEDHIRVVARGMLETKGYTVLDTGDPQMALHWAKSGVCFHLLLVDVVMPRMKGTELADRLKTLSPQTKVLLMSGYAVS